MFTRPGMGAALNIGMDALSRKDFRTKTVAPVQRRLQAAIGLPDRRRMSRTPELDRRTALVGALALAASPALAAERPRIALLGDSITAGYGLPTRDALPARLEAELKRQGVSARILAPAYTRQFTQAFAAVGSRPGVIFLPNLLGGVILNPDLNQSDGIHPNARGVEVIARRLAPFVVRGIRAG